MLKNKYNLSKYDFLDLGCKDGGSIGYCAKRFRSGKGPEHYAKGIGIDLNPESVKNARKAGYDAIQQDILKLDINHKFRFVSALDFLEHLPSLDDVEKIIKKMSELASDFLFIRHPAFEDVEYLKALDLKAAWTDWDVHTAPIKIYDFTRIFNSLGLRQYCFNFRNDLINSDHETILPLSAPRNSLVYEKSMERKKSFNFEKKVFSQIDIFVALKPLDATEWAWITREG